MIDYWFETIAQGLLSLCALLVILVPLGAWAVQAGRGRRIRNDSKED